MVYHNMIYVNLSYLSYDISGGFVKVNFFLWFENNVLWDYQKRILKFKSYRKDADSNYDIRQHSMGKISIWADKHSLNTCYIYLLFTCENVHLSSKHAKLNPHSFTGKNIKWRFIRDESQIDFMNPLNVWAIQMSFL